MEWEGLIIVLLCNNFAEVPNGPEKTLYLDTFHFKIKFPRLSTKFTSPYNSKSHQNFQWLNFALFKVFLGLAVPWNSTFANIFMQLASLFQNANDSHVWMLWKTFSWLCKTFLRPQRETRLTSLCVALCDLVPFVQFKKLEKHSWSSVIFREATGLVQFKKRESTHGGVLLLVKLQVEACNFTKITTPPWMFSRFLNCTNGTKSRKASHIYHLSLNRKSDMCTSDMVLLTARYYLFFGN